MHRYKGHTLRSTHVYIATDNQESEANQKFTKRKNLFVAYSLDNRPTVMVEVRSPAFDRVKSGHVSFKYLSNDERTKLLTLIIQYGNTASRVLAYGIGLGLNPRQIGAIRRWHIFDWRLLAPKF
jgi:hypothetical protein